MWDKLTHLILRNRIIIICLLIGFTAFMGYKASKVELSYEYVRLLPETDSAYVDFLKFKQIFGNEGNMVFFAVQDTAFFKLNKYNDWYELGNKIKTIDGVSGVISSAHCYELLKDTSKKQFVTEKILSAKLNSQLETDSISKLFHSLPFYRDFLYNDSSSVYLMIVSISKQKLDSKDRRFLIDDIKKLADDFGTKYNLNVSYSGLPFIRTAISEKVKQELFLFTILAFIVVIIVLFAFFRSVNSVVVTMTIVTVAVIWSLGTIVLLGYKITLLTGIIPPLLIVIGIPYSIYPLNKYHYEFRKHGNQAKALQRVIGRVGNAMFLSNLTTAVGFGTFIIASTEVLREFGLVASMNIFGIFILAVLIVPIFYSYLPPPREKHTKHLDNRFFEKIIGFLIAFTMNYRKTIYFGAVIFFLLSIWGLLLLKSTGYVVDDIPKHDVVYRDLKFFEKHFKGVIPLEIAIDTKKKNGAVKVSNFNKIEKLQIALQKYPELSRPISFNELVKFAKQSFYNGKEKHYKIPSEQEKNFIMPYIPQKEGEDKYLKSFLDSSRQVMRVSIQMADIGTTKMEKMDQIIRAEVDSIFPSSDYGKIITGTSIMYYKGTEYLISNLIQSVALAIFIISLIMAWMFRSFRMIVISLIPNVLPLLMTGALMGFSNIPIKPSTILVFSIAFGISVDNTLHFLSKYRQELKINNWNIALAVQKSLKEVGLSMIYTSIILFFGFGIFVASNFGGTVALGLLISFTLIVAALANLLLLPSFLMTMERVMTMRTLASEPFLQIYDEEDDIDVDELEIVSITKVE
ncbi:MAG: transporter [Bacteroidetes bacterium GWA2_31_9]|nr:MAG: transporter [Bacteroidetes bacterium GWA2_31_9]